MFCFFDFDRNECQNNLFVIMTYSLFVRAASSKLNGLSSKLSIYLSCSSIQNASTFRMAVPLHSNATSFLENSPQQSVLRKMDYSNMAPKVAASAPRSKYITFWILEKLLAASMVVTVPLAIAIPCKPLDIVLAVSLVAHIYWGFESIVKDYVRVILFGSVIPKICHCLLALVMMVTLSGLFYLIFDDIGIAQTIRRLWAIKSTDKK